MKRKIVCLLAAMSLLLAGCTSQSAADETQTDRISSLENYETQNSQLDTETEKQDEIQLLSLECVPELSLARLTAKITTSKPQNEIEDYYPNFIYGNTKVNPTEGGYLMSWEGIYDVPLEQLEAIDTLYYKGEEMKDASLQKESMEVTTLDAAKFKAKDSEENVFEISISKLGFKITHNLTKAEKMDKKRYFVAELKDGSEAIIWELPTLTNGKKTTFHKEPDKISELEENDAYLGTECGGAEDDKNGSVTIYYQSEIAETDVKSICIYE